MSLLRAIAQRCEIHDRPSWRKITELEADLGLPSVMGSPKDFVEQFDDPELFDCGHQWCRKKRRPA
jgi:hypothetical protein